LLIAIALLTWGSNCSQLSAYDLTAQDADTWASTARAALQLPSDEELLAKRQQAQQELHALNVALDEIPDGGWIRRVVHLDALQEQLMRETPDVAQLAEAYNYLRHRYDSTAQPHIDRLRNTVDQLHGWWALKSTGLNGQDVDQHLAVIQTRWQTPEAPLSSEQCEELRSSFAWLAQWRRLDKELAEVNQRLSRPNQVMILSGSYMKGLTAREIVHTVSINETQGDAQVSGQGDIRIVPALDLVPNSERGEVAIHVDGQGVVPLVAVSKPATVYADSWISFSGNQTLYLTPTGVDTPNPQIAADSNTSLRSVCLSTRSRILKCLLRGLVERLASRKLSESDVEAAQRAQQEIETQVVDNSLAFASQLNDMMDRFFFRTFDARDVEPNVRVQSTDSHLTWSAEYSARWQLGALTTPPAPAEPVGVLLQFHESAFNNASAAIGGVRMGEPAFQEVVFGMFRLQPPDDSWQQGARIPAALHLAHFDPLEIRFQDGRITAKLTIDSFEFGGRRVEGKYQLEATYEPKVTQGGVIIERIGDTKIQPQNGDDSALLEKAAARFFLPRAEARPKPNPRRGSKLAINYFRVENGWLSFGLSPTTASAPGPQE
jgi:hypothetical protein